MGLEVLKAVSSDNGMCLIAAVDRRATGELIPIPESSDSLVVSPVLEDSLGDAHVVVDFTNAEGAATVIQTAAANKVNVVIGSTGIPNEVVREANVLADENGVGIVIAPNFAMGAVLLMHLAKQAARFFDYADLTEMHHEAKIDAPSGTAIAIAKSAVEGKDGGFLNPKAEKEIVAGTRGGNLDGVTIHSARMPGRVAHHELVLGAIGQTLTIRHDSINRESFMPGVKMAIRHVVKSSGLTVGLDKIMGL